MQRLEKHKNHTERVAEEGAKPAEDKGACDYKTNFEAAAEQTWRRRPLWIAKIRGPIVIEDNKCAEDKGAPRQRKEEEEDEENEEEAKDGEGNRGCMLC